MSKAINFFNASRSLSLDTTNYMGHFVWGAVLKTRAEKAIKGYQATIDTLTETISKSNDEVEKKTHQATIDSLLEKIEKEQETLKSRLDAEAKFTMPKSAEELYKGYKSAFDSEDITIRNSKITEELRKFFMSYNLDVTGTTVEAICLQTISGEKSATTKQIINSGCTTWTTCRTKSDVLKALFGKLTELQLKAGTIKPAQVPSDVAEKFAPKKKGKKVETKKDEEVKVSVEDVAQA